MKSIRTLLTIAVALIASFSPARTQQCLSSLRPDSSGSVTFADMQRTFLEWSQRHDLQKTRGWKWYKRWEAFNEQRANADGSLPDAETVWNASSRAVREKGDRGEKGEGRRERGESGLYKSTASGWSPVGPAQLPTVADANWERGIGRINCLAFHPTDPNTMWVGVAQGGVWKTVNNGESWMPLTDDLPITRISDIAVDPNNANVLYISVGDYEYLGTDLVHENRKRNTHYGMGVFKTTDGGTTWNPTGLSFALTDFDGSLIRRVFVHPEDSKQLLAAGTSGTWRLTNGGTTWSHGRTDLIWDIERDPSDPNVLYASTGYVASFDIGSAGIIKSTDFGESWTTLPTSIPPHDVQRVELAIAPSDPNTVYAITCGNDDTFYAFYRSTNAGANWSTRADTSTAPNILGGSDGTGWDTRGQGTYDLAIQVDPTNKNRVIIGGINIWGSEDGGTTWNGVSYWLATYGASLHGDQHFFNYNPLNGHQYVCNDGGIYTTNKVLMGSWDAALAGPGYQWPTIWKNISDGLAITSFYRLGLSRNNPGYVVAGAQDNSTYYTEGNGWLNMFGGDGMECFIHPDDPGVVYGSSQYGYLSATDDHGASFRWELTRSILSNEYGEWTTPFAMHPTKPNILYAGFGNVWRTDGDDTLWRPISNFDPLPAINAPTPISAMSIAPTNPDYIYITKRIWHIFNQPSEMWMTSDGGDTWRNITAGLPDSLYLTYIATSASDPKTAWVTCGGFYETLKIFKTTDAGATWMNLSSGLPNLPVNCVVHDDSRTDNTIYVGTDIGVYYTSDKLQGWHSFNDNLPNVIVSELEINAATRKIYAATFGRGIWMSDLATDGINAVDANTSTAQLHAQIIPNPAHGAFTLQLDGYQPGENATLEIVDITGRQIYHKEIRITGNSHTEKIDLALSYGQYFLRIIRGNTTQVVRFVAGT